MFGEKRAVEDIKKNKITYYKYFGIYESFRYEKEFIKILSEYNIKMKYGHFGCLSWEDKEGEICYSETMKNEIIKRE